MTRTFRGAVGAGAAGSRAHAVSVAVRMIRSRRDTCRSYTSRTATVPASSWNDPACPVRFSRGPTCCTKDPRRSYPARSGSRPVAGTSVRAVSVNRMRQRPSSFGITARGTPSWIRAAIRQHTGRDIRRGLTAGGVHLHGGSELLEYRRQLVDGPRPLIDADVQPRAGRLPSGTLALTADGAAVLAGQADHVALNGIDRRLGGVRLVGGSRTAPTSERVWRWTGLSLLPPAS